MGNNDVIIATQSGFGAGFLEWRIETPHLALAALVWGPDDGIPVLALHGWLDNAASFTGVAPRLDSCRVVALDLPGHGHSAHRPPGTIYHFVDYVHDVVAAAEALDWERFSLLGHSLGAAVACFVAAALPERVTKLALVEGLGPLSRESLDNPRALGRSLAQYQQMADKRPPRYDSVEAAAEARRKAGNLSPAAARTLTERGIKHIPEGITWRSDPRLTFTSPSYYSEAQVLAFLAAIRAPTLLIRASQGYLVQREIMPARYRQVPGLELHDLPGGHHLHLEDPAPSGALLRAFLQNGAG